MRESDVDEDLIMEFAIRGMEHLASNKSYEMAVCFVNIENNQGAFPPGMLGIHGVMYKTGNHLDEMWTYVTTLSDANGDDDLPKEERVRGYLDPLRNIITFKVTDFEPVRAMENSGWRYLPLSNNAWDRSIICHQEFVGTSCSDWYIPDVSSNRFLTSFESGYLAVTYLRYPMNKDGEFLIPDMPEYTEALESYVLCKLYQRMWHNSKQGAEQKYNHYLTKWQWLCAAAIARMEMLSIPEWLNVEKQNKFFKDDSPLKIYGGYGKESMNFKRSPYPGRNYR
jgi:hypothetical protein